MQKSESVSEIRSEQIINGEKFGYIKWKDMRDRIKTQRTADAYGSEEEEIALYNKWARR